MGKVPRRLYRVFDDTSVSLYSPRSGFWASEPDVNQDLFWPETEDEEYELKFCFNDHIRMKKVPTPFISVYSCPQEARLAAINRVNKRKTGVKIAVIKTSRLRYQEFRAVRRLAKKLGYWIHPSNFEYTSFEWIILHRIPRHAIIGWMHF